MPITPSAGQTVNVYTGITGTLPISGTVVVSGAITASIANFPASYPGNANITASITLPVSATNPVTASISNWPTTFPGNVNITGAIGLTASISNLPVTQSVHITDAIIGVSQSNVPATQSVYVVNAQGSNVNITGTIPIPISGSVFTSGGLDVWVLNQTSSSLSGVNVVSGGLQVFASQSNPVWVTGAFSTTGGSPVTVYAPGSPTTTTGTLASASYSTASILLLAANATRAGYVVYNSSSAELFIGTTGSITPSAFTYRVAPRSLLEAPPPLYVGPVYGVWASGGQPSDRAWVTEYQADPAATGTTLYVSSTVANPLYVTGAFSFTPTPPTGSTLINGDVNITASITLPVSATNPVTASISNFPTGFNVNVTGTVTVPVSATNPVTASISNFPTGQNVNITGTITLPVSATNPVTASIANFPATQDVRITSASNNAAPLNVSGTVNISAGNLAGAISGSPQPVKALVSASDASVTLVANVAYRVIATTDGYLRDGGTADNTYHPFFSKIPEVWAFGGTTIHVILSASAATGSIWFSRII